MSIFDSEQNTVWVQIRKWRKYNDAKKTVKSTSWFRMENEWLEHPDFVDLSAEQCLLWPYLLGKASKKLEARGVVYISLTMAKTVAKMATTAAVLETLQHLCAKGFIRLIGDPSEAVFDDDDHVDEDEDSEDIQTEVGKRSEHVPNVSGKRREVFRTTERNETRRDETKRPKPGVRVWEPSDPLARVFDNLAAFSAYWAIFDVEHERRTLEAHRARNDLSIADLERVSWELRCWADGPNGAKVKSPRGTLATFVANFVKRRATDQPPPPPPKKKSAPVFSSVEELEAYERAQAEARG